MNNDIINSQTDYPADLSETLLQARTAAKLSQEEIAKRLHLPLAYIQSIETNQFQSIPQNYITVRGYIRSYARVVGINEWSIVENLERYRLQNNASKMKSSSSSFRLSLNAWSRISFKDKKFRWVTYGIVVLFLILVIVWWRNAGDKPVAELATIKAPDTVQTENTASLVMPAPVEPSPEIKPATAEPTPAPTHHTAPVAPAEKPAIEKTTPAGPSFHMDIGG